MGLQNDRRMMVVTPAGEFLTQREYPRLALVTPKLKDGTLELSAPNCDSIQFGIQTNWNAASRSISGRAKACRPSIKGKKPQDGSLIGLAQTCDSSISRMDTNVWLMKNGCSQRR